MLRSRIMGTGHFLPEKVLTNKDLEGMMDTSDEWIRQRTGIGQRHVAGPGNGASDLGAPAAIQALDSAGISAEEVDLIICATVTGDQIMPSTACVIQAMIGATKASAYDLNAACSGFLYGLAQADAFIRSGYHKTVLVIGSESITNIVNWDKRDTAVLFGDAAGAAVVRGEEGDQGILATYTGADGEGRELLYRAAGGSKIPITRENAGGPETDIHMNGRELFKQAVPLFAHASHEALKRAGLTIEDVDYFIPHQANIRIINAVAKRLKLPAEKVVVNIENVANTVAATIPVALDEAVRDGRIEPGKLVLLSAIGAGLTWGSVVIRW